MDIIYVDMGSGPDTGTGDTWYNAFIKVNHNFSELDGFIENNSFINLIDTPLLYQENSLVFTDNDKIVFKQLGSNSDIDPSELDSIEIDYDSVPGKIILRTVDSMQPGMVFDSDIDLNGYSLVNIASITQTTIDNFNTQLGTDYSIDDLIVNKRFTDNEYYSKKAPIYLDDIFPNTSYNISHYSNGNLLINNHALTNAYNGTPVKITASSNFPLMIDENEIYYMRVVNANEIALYNNKSYATSVILSEINNKISMSGVASGNSHYMVFADYDSNLSGSYLKSQAVPRHDVVLRSGDTMTGELFLSQHPSPYDMDITNLEQKKAATVYYVDKVLESATDDISMKEKSINNLIKHDFYMATGYYRAIVSEFNINKWNIGEDFGVVGGTKHGIIRDLKKLEKFTDRYIITYSTESIPFSKDDILTNGPGECIVLENYKETAQTRLHLDSQIDFDLDRTDGSEWNNLDTVSMVKIQLKPNIITNSNIHDEAEISQAKLNLNVSDIFDEDNLIYGWNSDDEYKDAVNGVCSFSNKNFDINHGFVRIKNHGITYNHLPLISDNVILGSIGSTGIIHEIDISDLMTHGGALTEENLDSLVFNKFDNTIFDYSNNQLSLYDNAVKINHLQKINNGYVFGRTSTGFGPVELISINELGANSLTPNDLGNELIIDNDKLIIKTKSINLNKLADLPANTVLGNDWNSTSHVKTIPLSDNTNDNSIVRRKSNGQISCFELQLSNNKILSANADTLSVFAPTGQLIFESSCSDSCDFFHTETTFNGSVNALSFNETSDERFKNNIETIIDPLSVINELHGVKFNWKHNDRLDYGLVAQEVRDVLPEIVTVDDNGYLKVSYTSLIGVIIEGIKEISNPYQFTSTQSYETGTVLVIGDNGLQETNQKMDPNIIGIVKKCHNGNIELFNKGKGYCKVLGKVQCGDRLVTSAIPGHAIVDNTATYAQCIGKSLQNKNNDARGVISVWIL